MNEVIYNKTLQILDAKYPFLVQELVGNLPINVNLLKKGSFKTHFNRFPAGSGGLYPVTFRGHFCKLQPPGRSDSRC